MKLPRKKQYTTPVDKEGKDRIIKSAKSTGINMTLTTGHLYESLENNEDLMAELKAYTEKTLTEDEIARAREERYFVTIDQEAKERLTRIKKISGKSEKVINGFIFKKNEEYNMMRGKWKARMKKANKKREDNEREESKAYQKTEPIKDVTYAREELRTRVPARNTAYTKNKTSIKLMLDKIPHYQTGVKYALENAYRWTKYNIQEIRTYLKEKELVLNPVTIGVITGKRVFVRADILLREYIEPYESMGLQTPIDAAKELYKELDITWRKPECSIWIERRLHLWEVSHEHAGLKKMYLTTEEWYDKMEIDFPPSLEPEANDVITNRNDLARCGILADLEHRIARELGIEDELERLCYTTELTPFDIMHAKNLIRENASHPHAILLEDKIKRHIASVDQY